MFGFYTLAQAAAPTVTAVSPSAGTVNGGQTVTITGANFTNPLVSGAAGVKFGGVNAASYSVVNDTTIQANTPIQAAGIVSVDVTNADGTNAANGLYTFTATNVTIQICMKVTIPHYADIQWGIGTTVDDAGVDHTLPAERITSYTWIIKDCFGTDLEAGSLYLSNDTHNAKTIMVENVSKTNATETITAVASNSAVWSIGPAPAPDVFQVRARMGAGAFQTLSATVPATLTAALLKGVANAQPLVIEYTTPTQTAAANVGVTQTSVLSLISTAN